MGKGIALKTGIDYAAKTYPDCGGSSTMVFNGEIINNPNDGKNMGEREVSDIVYFEY